MHIEDNLTWKEFVNLPREKGVTKERPGSVTYNLISEQKECYEGPTLGDDDYFYHFRVKDGTLFRVFGYQNRDMFCITHFDVSGDFHH